MFYFYKQRFLTLCRSLFTAYHLADPYIRLRFVLLSKKVKFKCLKVWYTFSRTRFLTWMHVHVAVEWKSIKPVIISIYAVLRTSCSCFGTWFHGLHNCDYLKCRGTWDQLREPHSSTSGWTRIYLFTEKLCHYSTEVI